MDTFKVGDKVKIKSGIDGIEEFFPCEAVFKGESTNRSDCIVVERMDGVRGSGQNGYWDFYKKNLIYLELVNKPKSMSNLKEKFVNLFLTEPTKSLRKAGVVNGDNQLTTDGQEIFLNWLLQKNQEAFNTEVVQKILADDEAKK